MADTPFVPVALEDIPFFMLDEWNKVYIDTLDDTDAHLAAHGIDTYYILSIEEKKITKDTTVHTIRNPQVFFVNTTAAYRSVIPLPAKDLNYGELEKKVTFTLPKIPYEMKMSIDDFFRAVDKKHQIESIVQLTFDKTKTDAEWGGWGFVIPKQDNTAAHCHYDPPSVVDYKEESADLVGSVHSHPEMPAYASGTDHGDQDNNDGLHITYGWEAGKLNGATQYHIELQADGETWTLQPHQVFEEPPARTVSPEIEALIEERVAKKVYTSTTSTSTSTASGSGKATSSAPGFRSNAAMRRSMRLADIKGLPSTGPSYEDNVIVAKLTDPEERDCPFCVQPLIPRDRQARMCTACHSYLAMPDEGVSDVFKVRDDDQLYTFDLDLATSPKKTIVLWNREETADSEFTTVYEPVAVGAGK